MSETSDPYPLEELLDRRLRTFEGRSLKEVAFPLGGIGTGTVSLGGRGDLRDWEIFNRPNKGTRLPYTFPAIWARGEDAVAKVLEARPQPPYTGSHGLDRTTALGLPRLEGALFRGEYPIAWVEFQDKSLPVEVTLEAFNPMIPLDLKDSGLPVSILIYRLRNPGKGKVSATMCLSHSNAVGYGRELRFPRPWEGFGGNLNEFVAEEGLSGIRMTSTKYGEDDPGFGSMAIATSWKNLTHASRWVRGEWWDDIQTFWDDFSEDGRLTDHGDGTPSPEGRTDVGSLGAMVELEPGGEAEVPFVIAWHFPNNVNEWDRAPEFRGKTLRNWYTTQWEDALGVARYVFGNFERLREETKRFHDALFGSTLPAVVLDAASSQMSTIRTNTCLRLEDGAFHAFEGCSETIGCCPMNCTHVWNYEQALAHLYPGLERTMRRTDFLINTEPDGKMAFRTKLPTCCYVPWHMEPAADGQMGCIVKLYREWQLSGDRAFLEELWPHAKRALEYAWVRWDMDRDGVMEGVQHNTYDIEFLGPNTMMGTIYLTALKAADEMARALGDPSANEYRSLYEKGSKKYDELLWNGEYYVQKYDPQKAPKYQYGEGCLSDQLLGQWIAVVAGLGHVLPEERVRGALSSILRHNWKRSLLDHENCQRIYALNDEAGLLLCTWPMGGRPALPFVYSDEVWTGIEYQVAAHMLYEGMIREGLTIVKGVRDRHDGECRNPWNEPECGDHYARAMASWALILALSGYCYSAPQDAISFAPKINEENFRCFYSTGDCWGVFLQRLTQERMRAVIEVCHGGLRLRTLGLGWKGLSDEAVKGLRARQGGRNLKLKALRTEDGVLLKFESPVYVEPEKSLVIIVGR
jgi:non-lysosomal glucosylceramidase